MKPLVLTLAALALNVPVALAQVQVVESRPTAQAQPVAAQAAPATAQQTDLFYRMQAMQQELLELRGLVEEQAHEINRLKQQRHDDYMDLDRRLSALAGGGGVAATGGTSSSAPTASSGDDGSAYKAAYAHLRNRELQAAISGFTQYLEQYPQGEYAANSQYWLGEIYLVEAKPEQAKIWFERVVKEFPANRKAPDAKYKLGTVLFQLGDKTRAKKLLQEVADSKADSARLARDFLNANY